MRQLGTLLLCFGTTVHLAAAVNSRIDAFTQTPANPVLEGGTVVVWCTGTGSGQRWYVNNIISQRLDGNEYMVRHYGNINFDLWNTSLTFIATLDRNETHIQCNLQGDTTHDSMGSTTVILASPPLAPATMLEDLHEGTVLRLSWTEPFSPTPYPVTSYHVVVYNDTISTDNVLVNVSINSTQHHYDFIKTNNTAACQILIFAASATSDTGTTVVGTFPMIPEVNDLNVGHEVALVDGIHLTVWFQCSTVPFGWLSLMKLPLWRQGNKLVQNNLSYSLLQKPIVCLLQEQPNYALDLLDENGHVVASSGLLEAHEESNGRVITNFTGLNPLSAISIRLTFMYSSWNWTQTVIQGNINIPKQKPPTNSNSSVDVSSAITSPQFPGSTSCTSNPAFADTATEMRPTTVDGYS